jgi:hypothetical protein
MPATVDRLTPVILAILRCDSFSLLKRRSIKATLSWSIIEKLLLKKTCECWGWREQGSGKKGRLAGRAAGIVKLRLEGHGSDSWQRFGRFPVHEFWDER